MQKRTLFVFHNIFHNKTFVNGTLFSLFSFFGQGMSFILLILLANYILPAEYGKLSLFTTIVTFLGFLVAFSSRGYCSITYFKKELDEFRGDFTAVFILGVVSFLLISLPIFFCGDWLGGKLELSKNLLWCAVLVAFFTFTFHLQQDYLRIREKIISFGIFNCSHALVNFVMSLILVISLNQNWKGRVNAQLICTLVYGVFAIAFFIKNKLFIVNVSKSTFADIFAWSLPMIPHSASAWIRQGLDRYIINYFYSTYEVGIFSFAINLSSVILMIGTAFNSSTSVTQFQILSDNSLSNIEKRKKLRHLSKSICLVYFVATIAVLSFSTALVYFLLPKYMLSIPYMWLLSLSSLGNCIYFIFCNYLFYYNKTKNLMFITFGTSILHLLLSLYFTRFSLYFTSAIYISVMALMAILVWFQSRKIFKKYLL